MADVFIPGVELVRKGVYVYQCPVCRKLFRYDDRYEPMCTGPSEMRDDHPPVIMQLLRRESRIVQV